MNCSLLPHRDQRCELRDLGPKVSAKTVATIEERGQMLSTHKDTMESPRFARSRKAEIEGPFRDWLATQAKHSFFLSFGRLLAARRGRRSLNVKDRFRDRFEFTTYSIAQEYHPGRRNNSASKIASCET